MMGYSLNKVVTAQKQLLQVAIIVFLLLLASCNRGGDGVPTVDPDFVETEDPNRFLQFLNPQVGLPAGNYSIVAGTQLPSESGSFTITVTRDDGDVQTFAGGWSDSGGTDPTSSSNPSFAYTMGYSGGINISIATSVSSCLFLLDAGGGVFAGQHNGAACSNPTSIDLPGSKINIAANAQAYYAAIDPEDTRTTLRDWQAANGFGQPCGPTHDPCEVHVIFRDTKDLGYGRDMYARRNEDGSFAVYVRNFRVDAVDGLQYSQINLDAAVANNIDMTREDSIQWHFGSNAIEFSTYPYGAGEPRANYNNGIFATNDQTAPMFTKFFTFKPDNVNDPNTVERRLDVVDLDSRGDKSMPGPCIACHGGKGRPLLSDGSYPPPIPGGVPGDTQAQMQVIEVSTLEFSDIVGYRCDDIIHGINFINQGVLSTYKVVDEQYNGIDGYWDPAFAASLIEGWYGDTNFGDFLIPQDQSCGYLRNNFYDYVPPSWRHDPSDNMPPSGAGELFQEVIAPNCMVCHSRRGVNLGTNVGTGETPTSQDIEFGSYEKFISHAEQIEQFIFHKGVMPLGLLNFDAFWDNSGPGRAEFLAANLPNFSSFTSDGVIQKPGRPYAVIASPRNTNVPVTISAEGSYFASNYRWRIAASPDDSTPSLSSTSSERVVFSTDDPGIYRIELVVSDGSRQSDPVTAEIVVSDLLPSPESIRFDPDIKNILQNSNLSETGCGNCHNSTGIQGVPVYYVDDVDQPEGRRLYSEVISRINFKEPLESLLLRKPSGFHHYGNCRPGFDIDPDTSQTPFCSDSDRSNYDLFLNWILNGAPR